MRVSSVGILHHLSYAPAPGKPELLSPAECIELPGEVQYAAGAPRSTRRCGMRFLILHVNGFCCTITTKGRSQVYEEYHDPVTRVGEALIVLTSVERGDERAPELVARRASAEISKLATQ